jgi:hypothetical protein
MLDEPVGGAAQRDHTAVGRRLDRHAIEPWVPGELGGDLVP